jgi:hypothetical protein
MKIRIVKPSQRLLDYIGSLVSLEERRTITDDELLRRDRASDDLWNDLSDEEQEEVRSGTVSEAEAEGLLAALKRRP